MDTVEKPVLMKRRYAPRMHIQDRAWMRERAIKYSSRAIKTIYEMIIDPKMPASVRMDGAKYIVDRAFGKAEQAIQLDASIALTPTDVAPVAMQIIAAMQSVLGTDVQGTDDTMLIDATCTEDQGTDVQGTDVQGTDVQGADALGTDVQGADALGTDDLGLTNRVSRWRVPKNDPVNRRGVPESTLVPAEPHVSKPSRKPRAKTP